MYPFIRLGWQLWHHRNDPPLDLLGTHKSRHVCWPWDLDMWRELNNGRTLTLYDLGRLPMAARMGMMPVLRINGWGMAVAGASVRWRHRVHAFERLTMLSRGVGWDARFIYSEQSLWKSDGRCASHALIRGVVTGKGGIVPPERVLTAMGRDTVSPPLPPWVADWIEADGTRPWPPMEDSR